MSDLRTMMNEAAPAATTVTDAVADADISRGRRLMRQRRAKRTAGASGLAALALVGGLLITGANSGADAPQAGQPTGRANDVALVAYTGEQPRGFVLDSVPSGWQVQSSTLDGVVLAPPGAQDRDPSSWVGKLGIQLSLDSSPDLTGSNLRVNGQSALIAGPAGSNSRILYVAQPEGFLVIQAWDNLGWSDEQLVEFGRSVHVTDAARGVGG